MLNQFTSTKQGRNKKYQVAKTGLKSEVLTQSRDTQLFNRDVYTRDEDLSSMPAARDRDEDSRERRTALLTRSRSPPVA